MVRVIFAIYNIFFHEERSFSENLLPCACGSRFVMFFVVAVVDVLFLFLFSNFKVL